MLSPRKVAIFFEDESLNRNQVGVVFPIPNLRKVARDRLTMLGGVAVQGTVGEFWTFHVSYLGRVLMVIEEIYPRWEIGSRCVECKAVTPEVTHRDDPRKPGDLVEMCRSCHESALLEVDA